MGLGDQAAGGAVADDALRQALHRALIDEYGNLQYYEDMVQKFGRSRRFDNLAMAETRHAEALLSLFQRYQLDAPDRDAIDGPQVPESWAAAIERAIEHEKANVAMYDELLQQGFPEDVRTVFTHLRDASATRHLPALQRGR